MLCCNVMSGLDVGKVDLEKRRFHDDEQKCQGSFSFSSKVLRVLNTKEQ